MWSLAAYFSYQVEIQTQHRFVEMGLYIVPFVIRGIWAIAGFHGHRPRLEEGESQTVNLF